MIDIIAAAMSHGIDLRAAVVFDGFILAEDCYCRLWRWQKDCWRPMAAGHQAPSYRAKLARKYALQNPGPQQQRSDEKRNRRERSRLSSNMLEHDQPPVKSPNHVGKNLTSG